MRSPEHHTNTFKPAENAYRDMDVFAESQHDLNEHHEPFVPTAEAVQGGKLEQVSQSPARLLLGDDRATENNVSTDSNKIVDWVDQRVMQAAKGLQYSVIGSRSYADKSKNILDDLASGVALASEVLPKQTYWMKVGTGALQTVGITDMDIVLIPWSAYDYEWQGYESLSHIYVETAINNVSRNELYTAVSHLEGINKSNVNSQGIQTAAELFGGKSTFYPNMLPGEYIKRKAQIEGGLGLMLVQTNEIEELRVGVLTEALHKLSNVYTFSGLGIIEAMAAAAQIRDLDLRDTWFPVNPSYIPGDVSRRSKIRRKVPVRRIRAALTHVPPGS